MSDGDLTPQQRTREEARRRRKLAEIFGDVLPEQTADDAGEADGAAGRPAEEKAQEEWLKSQVPPHHG